MLEHAPDRILVVDDEPMIRDFLHDALSLKGYTVLTASDGQEALDIIKRNNISAVITDIKMPKVNGAVLLKRIKELSPNIPVVAITAYGTVNGAVEVMKLGASDYISKPFQAVKLHQIMEELVSSKRYTRGHLRKIVTADPEMLMILETVDIVANSKASVFIQGESGTGKELIARAIHEFGERRNEPFVAVNCAALPADILESELFGHEPGSFTGAIDRRIGKFELADRGTLLLDEVAEMPPALQVKLLRSLQECEIDRIGSNAPIKVDVHVVATTNRDIREEIEKGRFRDDLFYRLCVVPIVIPPLRDRKGDIPLLVNHFLDVFSRQAGKRSISVSKEAMQTLVEYDWPGNVRELENLVERAVMFCRGDTLSADDFFPHNSPLESTRFTRSIVGTTLYDMEKDLIIRTLKQVDGNKTRAAEILGVTPRTIRNKLRQYTSEHMTQPEANDGDQ